MYIELILIWQFIGCHAQNAISHVFKNRIIPKGCCNVSAIYHVFVFDAFIKMNAEMSELCVKQKYKLQNEKSVFLRLLLRHEITVI